MTSLASLFLGWLGPVGVVAVLVVVGVVATLYLGRWAGFGVVAVGALLGAYVAGSREASRDAEVRDFRARAETAETSLASERTSHALAVAALEADRASAVARALADRPAHLRIVRVRPEDDGPVAPVLDDTLDHIGRAPR